MANKPTVHHCEQCHDCGEERRGEADATGSLVTLPERCLHKDQCRSRVMAKLGIAELRVADETASR
jgi:hypothetical protein